MKVKQNRYSKPFSLALMMEDLRAVSQMLSHLWGFCSFYKFYLKNSKTILKLAQDMLTTGRKLLVEPCNILAPRNIYGSF